MPHILGDIVDDLKRFALAQTKPLLAKVDTDDPDEECETYVVGDVDMDDAGRVFVHLHKSGE